MDSHLMPDLNLKFAFVDIQAYQNELAKHEGG